MMLCYHILASVLTLVIPRVTGHGRLLMPASRASAWRVGFQGAPANYDDNGLNCGGFYYQWGTQGGECGMCGDPAGGSSPHEAGGKYANGIITGRYTEGDVMDILVQITAHHKGWFEFRLCANNDITKPITQECLDQNLLSVETQSGTMATRYDITRDERRNYYIKAQLPHGLVCEQCVLQWKYNAGNSWGTDPVTGRGCLGCGPQEQFYGCSDIAIAAATNIQPIQTASTPEANPTTSADDTTSSSTGKPTSAASETTPYANPTTSADDTRSSSTEESSSGAQETTSQNTTSSRQGPSSASQETTPVRDAAATEPAITSTSIILTALVTETNVKESRQSSTDATITTQSLPESRQSSTDATISTRSLPDVTTSITTVLHETSMADVSVSGDEACRATSGWRQTPGMDDWCVRNCERGYCPKSHCQCGPEKSQSWDSCRGVGPWAQDANMASWCKSNCAMNYCPSSHCDCSNK